MGGHDCYVVRIPVFGCPCSFKHLVVVAICRCGSLANGFYCSALLPQRGMRGWWTALADFLRRDGFSLRTSQSLSLNGRRSRGSCGDSVGDLPLRRIRKFKSRIGHNIRSMNGRCTQSIRYKRMSTSGYHKSQQIRKPNSGKGALRHQTPERPPDHSFLTQP
jgi:hypothetical protein